MPERGGKPEFPGDTPEGQGQVRKTCGVPSTPSEILERDAKTTRKERKVNARHALRDALSGLKIGKPVSREALHLFPLTGVPAAGDDVVLLLEDALDGGTLGVGEVSEAGSVPELRVVNAGSSPVLILEGDELVGAKQNRVANSTALVAAGCEMVLAVSCVERGRWSRRPAPFARGGGGPHPSLRRLQSRAVHDSLRHGRGHRSDQGAVWEEVARVARLHDAASPTEALRDTRELLAERLGAFESLAGELPPDARGVIVALGGRCVLAEVMAGPRSFGKAFPDLLSGYALEALEHVSEKAPDASEAERLLSAMAAARLEEHPAVGAGTDVRFRSGGLSGYALLDGKALLHAVAFAS